ncbi:9419_t:CDS:2, partial [Funneliformis geosporum]
SSNTKAKRFVFPPPEEFERVAKYHLCKTILRYKRQNGLSSKEIAKQLKISIYRAEYILYSHIDKLTLDELVSYAESLHAPFELRSSYENQETAQISPYYEKHNHEYLEALKKREIKPTSKQLAEKLITDDLIRKVLVPQLDGEEIDEDGERNYHKLNSALGALGLPEMDIEPVITGVKAGTILPSYIVGVVEEGLKLATGVTKATSHLVDRVKDALVDASLSGINSRIGDLKGELDGTNEKLDKQ